MVRPSREGAAAGSPAAAGLRRVSGEGQVRASYGFVMRSVPWWILLSSVCAPVLLVVGWTVSALLQGPGYDPAAKTISILAASGADGYWVMTPALVALGLCHLTTASGLHLAALPGRLTLGAGGLSAMMLALFPAPSSGGSLGHGAVVTAGFSLLAVWPVLAVRRTAAPERTTGRPPAAGRAPWGLRHWPSLMATTLMWLGGGWFLLSLSVQGTAGVAERVLTFAQSFWPLVVVLSCVRHTDNDEEAV